MSSPVGAEVAGTVPYVKSGALIGYHSRCAASAVAWSQSISHELFLFGYYSHKGQGTHSHTGVDQYRWL